MLSVCLGQTVFSYSKMPTISSLPPYTIPPHSHPFQLPRPCPRPLNLFSFLAEQFSSGLLPSPTSRIRQPRPLSPHGPLRRQPLEKPIYSRQCSPSGFHPYDPRPRTLVQGGPLGFLPSRPLSSPHLPGPPRPHLSIPSCGPVRAAPLTLPCPAPHSLLSGAQRRRGEAIPSGTAPSRPRRGPSAAVVVRALAHRAPYPGGPLGPP